VETAGPECRFGGVLLLEKAGLLPVVRAAWIGERFDLMVAATQGQGVTAVKEFIEELAEAHPGVTVYLLHDFDIDGTSIAACLAGKDSKSWRWSVEANVIDLGLSLEQVKTWNVQDESVTGSGDRIPLLRDNGCDQEEIDYLVAEQRTVDGKAVWSGRRAELNGLIGQRFINFIEARLDKESCEKVIPGDDALTDAYTRAAVIARINAGIEQVIASLDTDGITPPDDLADRLADLLHEEPDQSWDEALIELVAEDTSGSEDDTDGEA
jgi:hypothetical protein